jgi:caffeoyl-CoA O-methyltransferase
MNDPSSPILIRDDSDLSLRHESRSRRSWKTGLGRYIMGAIATVLLCSGPSGILQGEHQQVSDARVSKFLNDSRESWGDLNIPYEDGEILYELILTGGFKNVLEIGTSTGHSTIWLAWAASKNGGRVTTIEIDKGRYEKAISNFIKAGVANMIDARLADAHSLVPTLQGPYDFVFCDADKEWYVRYFRDLELKIGSRGCFSAHNVLWSRDSDIKSFLDYVRTNPAFTTSINHGSGQGISITCRIAK